MSDCFIKAIRPSIFIRQADHHYEQMIRVDVSCGRNMAGVELRAECGGGKLLNSRVYELRQGDSTLEFFTEALETARDVLFSLHREGAQLCARSIYLTPPRRWTVHVVQLSHHDPGYTDLPSNVLNVQRQNLIEAMEYAENTDSYPEDAKFRIVIEQMWSLSYFLKTASPEQCEKMIGLLQSSRFEMTALFGNMTTEICGHETLIRAAYHSAELARRYGIPLVSAEHNDIPGISWGLSRVLTDIGVKIFCPGLPLYYGWGSKKFRSFWSEEEIFGTSGPGAF